jgi:hypothetical protein
MENFLRDENVRGENLEITDGWSWKENLIRIGGSVYLLINPELLQYLGLEKEEGKTITVQITSTSTKTTGRLIEVTKSSE